MNLSKSWMIDMTILWHYDEQIFHDDKNRDFQLLELLPENLKF
jgi:hypothetical protein